MIVFQSLPFEILRSIFLYQQNAPNKKAANRQRHQIVMGGGIEIYLPNTPDVLINKIAKFNSAICFKCWFFILYVTMFICHSCLGRNPYMLIVKLFIFKICHSIEIPFQRIKIFNTLDFCLGRNDKKIKFYSKLPKPFQWM